METLPHAKVFICTNCKQKQVEVGVEMLETNYYRLSLDTEQWKDFHGDTFVESTKYFCICCDSEISNKIVNTLMK